jgi:hypothetical protein
MPARKPVKMARPFELARTSVGILPLSIRDIKNVSVEWAFQGIRTNEAFENLSCLIGLLANACRFEKHHIGYLEFRDQKD